MDPKSVPGSPGWLAAQAEREALNRAYKVCRPAKELVPEADMPAAREFSQLMKKYGCKRPIWNIDIKGP